MVTKAVSREREKKITNSSQRRPKLIATDTVEERKKKKLNALAEKKNEREIFRTALFLLIPLSVGFSYSISEIVKRTISFGSTWLQTITQYRLLCFALCFCCFIFFFFSSIRTARNFCK